MQRYQEVTLISDLHSGHSRPHGRGREVTAWILGFPRRRFATAPP